MDPEQERGRQEDIGNVFQFGASTGAAVWGGEVGADPTDREGTGQLYALGRGQDHGETAAERVGQEVVLPLSGGAMKEAWFTEIRGFITNRQNTFAQYITT